MRCFELTTKTGKQREIASINVIDRFIEKLIQLKLREHVEPMFLARSFAYQEGKGIVDAAAAIRDYVVEGCPYLCELDIKDYYGSIHLGRLRKLMSSLLTREIADLIWTFLTREVEREGKIARLEKGILQGSPMSPALANLYLHPFDQKLEDDGLHWMRFSDNIYLSCGTSEEASDAFKRFRDELGQVHQLGLNKKKSGVYKAVGRRILGYDLIELPDGKVEVRKHSYVPFRIQNQWATSVIRKSNGEFHIVQDGVINRKDYSLSFVNEDEKHHIPVGVTEQINIYGNVTISPAALATITKRGYALRT